MASKQATVQGVILSQAFWVIICRAKGRGRSLTTSIFLVALLMMRAQSCLPRNDACPVLVCMAPLLKNAILVAGPGALASRPCHPWCSYNMDWLVAMLKAAQHGLMTVDVWALALEGLKRCDVSGILSS